MINLNRIEYRRLVAEDVVWLRNNAKDCLERKRIIEVLDKSVDLLYPPIIEEVTSEIQRRLKDIQDEVNEERWEREDRKDTKENQVERKNGGAK